MLNFQNWSNILVAFLLVITIQMQTSALQHMFEKGGGLFQACLHITMSTSPSSGPAQDLFLAPTENTIPVSWCSQLGQAAPARRIA